MESKHLSEKQRLLISRGGMMPLWGVLVLASFILVSGLKLWHIFSAPGVEQYRYIGIAGLALGTVTFLFSAIVLIRVLVRARRTAEPS